MSENSYTIDNKDLADHLTTLALMCIANDTDNCDITLSNKKLGNIRCHIEFSNIDEQTGENNAD